jgi:hypothetical protein
VAVSGMPCTVPNTRNLPRIRSRCPAYAHRRIPWRGTTVDKHSKDSDAEAGAKTQKGLGER